MTIFRHPIPIGWEDRPAELHRFATRSPQGDWRLDHIERAPSTQTPDPARLELLRIPPVRPWRIQRAKTLLHPDGEEWMRIVPETIAHDPRHLRLLLDGAFDYDRDMMSMVAMWVDATHDWVFALMFSDQFAIRRWVHPLFQPEQGEPDHDRWQDIPLSSDEELLSSMWYSEYYNVHPGDFA